MCLIWCTPLVWCLSRSKVNKGLPSPSLLAASSSDYPSFQYCAVSSSYFPPISSSSYVFFLTYCSLSLFLFLPFPLPVCPYPVLPLSCLHSALSYLFPILVSLVLWLVLSPACFPGSPQNSCFLSLTPQRCWPHTSHTPLQFFTHGPLSGPHCQSMSACLLVCLRCALVCVCVKVVGEGWGAGCVSHLSFRFKTLEVSDSR